MLQSFAKTPAGRTVRMGWVTHGMGPAFADRNVCIAVFSGVENALGIKERLATAGVEAATLNAKMVRRSD